MTLEKAREKLEKYGQQHVLRYFEELTEREKESLLLQIEETDFDIISSCRGSKDRESRGVFAPLSVMQLEEIEKRKEEFTNIGYQAIKDGQIGAILLAGGMGTRLGSDDPKGVYNIGITKDVFIFQRIIENLLDVVKMTGAVVPLFIMTSDKNHKATTEFLAEHQYFGYDKEYVFFFQQEMAVATDYEGKVYLEEKGRMSTSPNGNGGWFVSMKKAGYVDKLHQMGVKYLNVFAVDNVLQRVADPCFVGAVVSSGCAVGSKVVRKNAPDEKVGVMCLEDGRPSIVEYYDLTEEMMEERDEQGQRAYDYGVILNYLFRVQDLEDILSKKLKLHVVEKKITYIDDCGNMVRPEKENGCKFEQLVLDMIHELDSCLPYEVVRNHEFAPIKNRTGVDSVDSARALLAENGIEL